MERRVFIRKSCSACLSMTALAVLASGCAGTKYVTGTIGKDGITVTPSDFKVKQKGGTAYASFIIVRNDDLSYPICVYRFTEGEYTALWMRCTHQGAELQASGDVLQCSAHGSEFNSHGQVRSGPASAQLRTFPVIARENEIFIDLRKQS
jgi:Rieske Fe-S protein